MSKQKSIIIALLAIMLLSMACSIAFAAGDSGSSSESIKEKVKQYQGQGGEVIEEEVDKVASNIIGLVRGIAGILGVVFLIWAGFVFWGAGGNPQQIAFAKKMMAGFVICLILIFTAEKIVGGLLGLLGYEI